MAPTRLIPLWVLLWAFVLQTAATDHHPTFHHEQAAATKADTAAAAAATGTTNSLLAKLKQMTITPSAAAVPIGVGRACWETLVRDCGELWHGAGDCYICVQSHYASLTAANCTTADTHAFCTPNVRCRDGLRKYCYNYTHQSGPCWECVGNHSEDLAALGCTTAETHAFCSTTVPCDEGLYEVCGEYVHQGKPCTDCIQSHASQLIKCTSQQLDLFCNAQTHRRQKSIGARGDAPHSSHRGHKLTPSTTSHAEAGGSPTAGGRRLMFPLLGKVVVKANTAVKKLQGTNHPASP